MKVRDHTLHLEGILNYHEVTVLCKKSSLGLSDHISTIELSNLSYIDSAGIALLIEWCKICQQTERQLSFSGMNTQLNRLLNLYDLDFIN